MTGNVVTPIDTIEVRDLEDNSKLVVTVQACSEMGNQGLPGIQVIYMGQYVNFEPLHVERWAYQARKAGQGVWLLADCSWNVHEDQYVRNYLVVEGTLSARVEVKTRSMTKAVVRDYPLPFALEN